MNTAKKSLAVAAAATGTLLAVAAAPAVGTPHVRSAASPTPTLTVTMSSKPSVFKVAGVRTFPAGRVNLTLVAGKGEQEVAIGRLHKGYTLADLKRDFQTFGQSARKPTPQGLRALRHVVHNTTFYGGIDSAVGNKTVTGSVVLPRAGTYYVFDDDNLPGSVPPVKLHVTAPAGSRVRPAISVTQTATTAKRFTGPVDLPASGTIQFHNASTQSPHFLFLQHVRKGTTRKQVIDSFKSNARGPELPGAVGTDVVFMGLSMTLTYTLPAGDYAEMCFFPDLKTGMPHAFMGMVRIVHLS